MLAHLTVGPYFHVMEAARVERFMLRGCTGRPRPAGCGHPAPRGAVTPPSARSSYGTAGALYQPCPRDWGRTRSALERALGMPDPKVVIADAKGSNRLDQLAQMSATLQLLADVVVSLALKYPSGYGMKDPRDVELYQAYLLVQPQRGQRGVRDHGRGARDHGRRTLSVPTLGSDALGAAEQCVSRRRRVHSAQPAPRCARAARGQVPRRWAVGRPNLLAQWKAQDRVLGFESFIQPVAGPALEFLSSARGHTAAGIALQRRAAGIARAVLLLMLLIWAWRSIWAAQPDWPPTTPPGR